MAREPVQEGYGVIGLGRFGMTLMEELARANQEVLAIDSSEIKIRQAREVTDAAFVADTLDRETLMSCGVQNCDTVIVAIGERIDTSILTTLTVLQLGVRRVIAKAISPDQGAVLQKLGAEVIYPESDMAVRLARRLTKRRVLDYLHLSDEIEVTELEISGPPFVGHTVASLDLRRKYGLNIIAIAGEEGGTTDIAPDRVLQEGDALVVIGRKDKIDALESYLSRA